MIKEIGDSSSSFLNLFFISKNMFRQSQEGNKHLVYPLLYEINVFWA